MNEIDEKNDFEPDTLEYSCVGMPTMRERSVLWHGDALVLYEGETEQDFHPSEEQWQSFWKTLDRIKAWDWNTEYTDLNVIDGEAWSLVISFKGKHIKSGGANAYPPGFDDFRWAVERLLAENTH